MIDSDRVSSCLPFIPVNVPLQNALFSDISLKQGRFVHRSGKENKMIYKINKGENGLINTR